MLHFILFALHLSYLLQLYPVCAPISGAVTRKGLTTPLTCRVARIFYLCAGVFLRCVAWFSYWFDNLGFISEGNTYRRCAASSLPLWGNTDVASSDIKRNSWRRCREDLQHIPGFQSQISSPRNLHYLPFASRFPLPHFTKNCCFIRPSFLFAIFLPDLFLSAILLCSHHDSREHQIM